MKYAITTVAALFVVFCAGNSYGFGKKPANIAHGMGDASISGSVKGSTLTIATNQQMAGAISHLVWKGKEFINMNDHGRELQSASSFDNLGECYNPTEAGSSPDTTSSTSILQSISTANNILSTTSQMAFWLAPGSQYNAKKGHPNGCNEAKAFFNAQNPAKLSQHILTKTVKIGFNGIDNAIEYNVDFYVPQHYNTAVFEALTAYLQADFSSFWIYNPASGAISSAVTNSAGAGSNLPVIASTGDQNYAIGVYTPDPNRAHPSLYYGRWAFPGNTNKWNTVYNVSPVPAGHYSLRTFVVVGNLRDVQSGISALYHSFYPSLRQ